MRYEVHDGRVLTWSLECHVVDHCNLRCVQCCTRSPDLPARFVDPATLRRDLAALATALKPALFKLTGGEPLLHPDLVACVEAARASGIAGAISMTTNGLLAASAPEALWAALDRVTVSLYPSAPLPPRTRALIEDRCVRHGVRLTFKEQGRFQRITPDRPWDADADVQRVYDGCWMKVRCHTVREGRFTVCTRARDEADGVDVHEPDLLARLLGLLERPEPLRGCRDCLGATGDWLAHAQKPLG